jgi:hypothetical protein
MRIRIQDLLDPGSGIRDGKILDPGWKNNLDSDQDPE